MRSPRFRVRATVMLLLALSTCLALPTTLSGCLPSPSKSAGDGESAADTVTDGVPSSTDGLDGSSDDLADSGSATEDGSMDALVGEDTSPSDLTPVDATLPDGEPSDLAPSDVAPADATQPDLAPADIEPDTGPPLDLEAPDIVAPVCGGISCPTVKGFISACNAKDFCEYTKFGGQPWEKRRVWIYLPPADDVPIGRPDNELPNESKDEQPQHLVSFGRGILVGKYEVTTEIYQACRDAQKCGNPRTCTDSTNSVQTAPDHPQNCLAYADAVAVCTFLGGRLPTEAEWEYSAHGKSYSRYPWGDQPPVCKLHAWFWEGLPSLNGCGTGGTAVVDATTEGSSPIGALSMGGNVLEWVADCYHSSYTGAPSDGQLAWESSDCSLGRVLRGGSFAEVDSLMRTTSREQVGEIPSTIKVGKIGARCVRELD